MIGRLTLVLMLLFCWSRFCFPVMGAAPNIVYILADDLGYGDVRCLNPDGKIATPQLDQLAREGMLFTDAHSGSSVCTPTRYGILTGRYAWRSRLKHSVLYGYDPPLIEPGRLTVAELLQRHGYHTACVGKWHLGLGWTLTDGSTISSEVLRYPQSVEKQIDFKKPIDGGPTALGFNYFFGISASLDMPPYVYIENDEVITPPTSEERDVKKEFRRAGAASKEVRADQVMSDFSDKAAEYVTARASQAKNGTPFFLYVPLTAPHTPIAPSAAWRGKSKLTEYCDFVMEVDALVGRLVDQLEQLNLTEDTIVIFTSDNGCSPEANYRQLADFGHNPSYLFRGHKADIFEGGHRVPFFVKWPQRVKPGTRTDELVCLTDLMATCAEIVGAKLPENAAEDSISMLSTLEGRLNSPVREAVIHHSIRGRFAIREGDWKLCMCPGSGGWSHPRPGTDEELMASLPPVQLYNLNRDVHEEKNLHEVHPERVAKLTALLEKYVDQGRSTPGSKQPNNGDVNIRHSR